MKKIVLYAFLPWIMSAFGYKAMAQEKTENKNSHKTQEIIIRKKGDKDVILKLEFKDDKILIDGKSLLEFNDDEISINNRKIEINSDKFVKDLEKNLRDFDFDFELQKFGFQSGPAKAFLGVSTTTDEAGAKIEAVTEKSPAAEAGLQKDDIISKVGNEKVSGPEDLVRLITAQKPGDKVKITFKRKNKTKTLHTTLGETKNNNVFSITVPGRSSKSLVLPRARQIPSAPLHRYRYEDGFLNNNNDMSRGFFQKQKPSMGIKIQDTEDESGVKILAVESGSLAAKAGLLADDVLIALADRKISNTDDAREALVSNKDNKQYPVKVKRAGKELSFTITVPKVLKTVEL